MFLLKQKRVGAFLKYQLLNKGEQSGFSIFPERGAVLTDLFFQDNKVIDGYRTTKELQSLDWAKSALLLPFPNRLRDGKYQFEKKEYQFPVNEKNTNTAIHGFGMAKKMKVDAVDCNEEEASITCSYKDSGRRKAYPFPHHFQVVYKMKNNAFTVHMIFTNAGNTNLPVGLGWHPYFKLGKNINDHKLKLPKAFSLQKIEIDNSMIPSGARTPFSAFQRLSKIENTNLDNCFFIEKKEPKKKRFEILLSYENQKLTYWQETGNNAANFVQLFTPPKRNSLAIEPMSCNIDAFNNLEGLKMLKPGEVLELKCGVVYG